jgi:oligopeptide/dipeptide ABC transporter ATP-binding protein
VTPPLLDIRGLRLHFDTYRGRVHALNGVDLSLQAGELTGLIGETGSGKSVTARAILRLLDANAVVTGGQILFEGRDLLGLGEHAMRRLRGKEICLVFQDARAALNPVFSVGHQLAKIARIHTGASAGEAKARSIQMLARVGIAEPELRCTQVPQQLSGGMCQRVMLAMALMCSPKLIVLDEPTTGLDVTVQSEILELIQELVASSGAAALLITHDLGVVAQVCQRVSVMYAGRVVEDGAAEAVFTRPLHPYAADLHAARLDVDVQIGQATIRPIPGSVPDLRHLPRGCPYAPRCALRADVCDTEPDPREIHPGHSVRCFRAELLLDQSV